MKYYTLLLYALITASTIIGKAYTITNLTPHEKLDIQITLQGTICKKQTKNYSIKKKESKEILDTPACPLASIEILPRHGIQEPFNIVIPKDLDRQKITTIAIKQSHQGYKLSYY